VKSKIYLFLILAGIIVMNVFLVSAVGGFSSSSSSFTYVNHPNLRSGFSSYYGSNAGIYWPIFQNSSQCKSQEDVLLYVRPGACQPAVVRSDLLAEQNVPVFCQIDAIKLNPLMDIKEIRDIGFSGKYPKEIATVGFHPAYAALRTHDILLGDPVLNNIGYAVVVLKKQANESSLPEFINVTMSGTVRYDAGNALGIGRSEFMLQDVGERDWQLEQNKQTFWNGRFSVRAENIQQESLLLTIYDGGRRVSSSVLARGKISDTLYLPGGYCPVGVRAVYEGMEPERISARLEISASDQGVDKIDVYQGSKIFDRCSVNKVVSTSINNAGFIELSCPGEPLLRLSINARTSKFSEGDIIPGDKRIYTGVKLENKGVLSDVGSYTWSSIFDSSRFNSPLVCEVNITAGDIAASGIEPHTDFLPGLYSAGKQGEGEIWRLRYRSDYSIKEKDALEIQTSLGGWSAKLKDELVRKCEGRILSEKSYDNATEKYFTDSIQAYEKVAEDYPLERDKDIDSSEGYGARAFQEAINLADKYGKHETKIRLMQNFIETYPSHNKRIQYESEINNLLAFDYKSSGTTVLINGRYRTIRLVGFTLPKADSTSASFLIEGREIKLAPGEVRTFETRSGNEGSVLLQEITDSERAEIRISCPDESPTLRADLENAKKRLQSQPEKAREKEIMSIYASYFNDKFYSLSPHNLRVGASVSACGVPLVLNDINIGKVARVRLEPADVGRAESKANVTVHIGIEKRAIKLSPEKSLEKIANLNTSIQQWESISKRLSTVVTGLKGACFATAGVLTVKNFIDGIDGTTLAREHAMSGSTGWKQRCKDAIDSPDHVIDRGNGEKASVSYRTLTECFNGEKEYINSEVEARTKSLANVNTQLKQLEKQPEITSGAFAGGKSVNTVEATRNYLKDLNEMCNSNQLEQSTCDYIKSLNEPDEKGNAAYRYSDLRELHYNALLKQQGYTSAGKQIDETKKRIDESKKFYEAYQKTSDFTYSNYKMVAASAGNIADIQRPVQGSIGELKPLGKNAESVSSYQLNGKEIKISQDVNVIDNAQAAMIVAGARTERGALGEEKVVAKKFLVVGNKVGNRLEPTNVYEMEQSDSNGQYSITSQAYAPSTMDKFRAEYQISVLENSDSVYMNSIRQEDWKVRYFETGVDKGFAALVPFDVTHGWYVKVKSNLPVGNEIAAYDSSGLPKLWYICNAGSDTRIDESDQCQSVFEGISSDARVFGLSNDESRKLIRESREALFEANRQRNDPRGATINNNRLQRGTPVTPYEGVQCQDFMSPGDCKLLFNVCDPVICPPTRCNLGGQYPVADVVQTGIIGSTLLCLPNYREGVYIPVCLTGIQAGIDSYVSILKSYRDCLQENVKSGQLVGICDQVTSVYLCEFFWRQVAPVAKVLLPKLVESAYGQGARGGGEYLTVMHAWQNMENSVNYFKQSYAVNAFNAFKLRSIEEAGTPFCKSFISAKSPTQFKSLLEPESPPQFHAWFSSIPFTSATLPATSQYKVFYHIFGGKDSGVYYRVYLKNPPGSEYYAAAPIIVVDSAFIPRGQYKTETKDFTAPEGYNELCIQINGKEECGFGQVSTSFATNYLRDIYVKEELEQNDITSERACISGSPSPKALLANTNPQAALEEAAIPQAYERGIIRICANENPGGSTEPSRYVDMGHCGDPKLRCWLDQKSVDNAITEDNLYLKNKTLEEIRSTQRERLEANGEILPESDANALIRFHRFASEEIASQYERDTKTSDVVQSVARERERIDNDFGRDLEYLFLNHHKAAVLMIKAELTRTIAIVAHNSYAGKGSKSSSDQVPTSRQNQDLSGFRDSGYFIISEQDLGTVAQKKSDGTNVKIKLYYNYSSKFFVMNEKGKWKNAAQSDVSGNINVISVPTDRALAQERAFIIAMQNQKAKLSNGNIYFKIDTQTQATDGRAIGGR